MKKTLFCLIALSSCLSLLAQSRQDNSQSRRYGARFYTALNRRSASETL